MICISITQESRRLALADMLNASRQCDLLEVRLDRFGKAPDLGELLAAKPKPVIMSCRRQQDGGELGGQRGGTPGPPPPVHHQQGRLRRDRAGRGRPDPQVPAGQARHLLHEPEGDARRHRRHLRRGADQEPRRHQADDAGAHAGGGLAAGADPGQVAGADGRGRPGQAGRHAHRAGPEDRRAVGLRRPGTRHGGLPRPADRQRPGDVYHYRAIDKRDAPRRRDRLRRARDGRPWRP